MWRSMHYVTLHHHVCSCTLIRKARTNRVSGLHVSISKHLMFLSVSYYQPGNMDQESKDANSLLVELDRGLQSGNIGDQSEAVVRFSKLFHKHPLPIIINAACLKLSETFKNGSNFIRVQISEVFERNPSHLNKIYSIDDFYRNIFTVTTSNDPIARSITLLTLGHIAPIVSEYKSIHHCISSSLESSFECELNATIACAAKFVKQSSEFACNIYPKMVSILDSESSSQEVKLRALSVLDHGFYNANDAMTVRTFLIDIISRSKIKRLICACLTLTTKIAYTSLSHITPQINLLLTTFLANPDQVIRVNALRNLRLLAEKSPHIWESSQVEPLISYVEATLKKVDSNQDCQYLSSILLIFCRLLTCKCNFIASNEKNRIYKISFDLILDTRDTLLYSMAFELLAAMSEDMSSGWSKEDIDTSFDVFEAVKAYITRAYSINYSEPVTSNGHLNSESLTADMFPSPKTVYRHIVTICRQDTKYCRDLIKLIIGLISNKKTPVKYFCPYITELMCALLQTCKDGAVTSSDTWNLIKSKSSVMTQTNFLNLCVLHFQVARLARENMMSTDLVNKVVDSHDLWFSYKVMRQAMRYGHYSVAESICKNIHDQVTTDTMDFYFKSLKRICAAESCLISSKESQQIDVNLRKSLSLYEEALSPLRASVSHSKTNHFQLKFLWLRIRSLQAHGSLRQCCKIHDISPMSYSTLLSAVRGGSDLAVSKLGAMQQMPKIAKDFRYLGECYENLSTISFNCDDRTLDYIQLLRCSCIIMADVIDAVFQYGKNLPVISRLPVDAAERPTLEHRDLVSTCSDLIKSIKTELLEPGIVSSSEPIDPVISLIKRFSDSLLRCPFMYPRYFFQPLQMTEIRLAITPQPSTTGGSISVPLNQNLVLEVEGLVQNASKSNTTIRDVSKVVISVSMNHTKQPETNTSPLAQSIATPVSNYFKTEFLLPLKWAGTFSVDIEVSILDEQERLWKTGPIEKLNLVVS